MIERAPATLNLSISKEFLEMTGDEAVISLMAQIDDEYYYWNTVKRLPMPNGVQPFEVWNITKIRRRLTPHKLKFGSYSFHWNTNNKLQELLHFLDVHIGGSKNSPYNDIPKEDKNRYLVSALMEEAIASSQIEGAATTRKQAKEMLRQNKKPTNRSEQMIVNNYSTITRIMELRAVPLSKELLLEIHELITRNTLFNKEDEGTLRYDDEINVVDNATGEVVHHPPDVAELDSMLDALIRFFNDEDSQPFIHPLIKASIIHFMVGFIHPFVDGNGRTARALFYWYLLKNEYWLTEYLSISRMILRAKAQYARAFQYTEVDEHDLTYFILYNLRTMKLAFDELTAYVMRKKEEQKALSEIIGADGISYRQSVILDWFYKDAELLLTVKELQNRLAVSNQTARNDLHALTVKGYLQSKALNKVTVGYQRAHTFNTLIAQASKKHS